MPSKEPVIEPTGTARKQRGPDQGGRAKSRTLTAVEFEAIRPFLGSLSTDRIEAARLAMVEKAKFAEIAKHFGWQSRQAVDGTVARVWQIYGLYRQSQEAVASANSQTEKSPARSRGRATTST